METSTIITMIMYGLLAWFLYTRIAPVKGLSNLNAHEFKSRLEQEKNIVLIDVREPNEYKSGYIPGAMNIPLSQLKRRVGELSKDQEVFLYCRSGMRSKQAARILSKNGIRKLSHMHGGILAWNGKLNHHA